MNSKIKHYIIPIFIPHYGCTHECVFCNQRKITGQSSPVTTSEVSEIIKTHLSWITEKRFIEAAFYGGSFTALNITKQCELLTPAYEALQRGEINAIRLSTRPDCISAEIVQNLVNYGVSTIELGVQSLDNKVLKASARGHEAEDVIKAVSIIRKFNVNCGIQIMPGLPSEDWLSLIATIMGIVGLKPDFVRVYPTIVIAGTKLAVMYQEQSYQPLSLFQAIVRSAYCKLKFEQNGISVIRTGLQATEDLADSEVVLAGPYHPAFGEMVEAYIFYIMLAKCMESIILSGNSHIIIHHHTRDTSKLRGQANINIKRLQEKYKLAKIVLLADGLVIDELSIEYSNINYVINKKMLFYL